MTNTKDKNPQALQTQPITNTPTSVVNTPSTAHQPKPDAKDHGTHNSDPKKVKNPTTTGTPTKQPLDPNDPQATNDGTKKPVADEAKIAAKS